MDDKNIIAQGIGSEQAAADAQAAINQQSRYSGGSALLDAQIETNEPVDDPAINHPSATDI